MISTILAICAVLGAIGITVHTFLWMRKDRNRDVDSDASNRLSDYDVIAQRTREVTSNRLPNHGIHYEDESVFLNRATEIAKQGHFFKLVNHR